MSDTPKTDALREVIVGQYKEDELTGDGMGNILSALTDIETLERERECECKCDVDWPEEYYELRQRLERERDVERALADLLASSLLLTLSAWITSPDAERAAAALRVWKEARSE